MLDVHLMIERPERHAVEFIKAGAHSVTFHVEATPHAAYVASLIRDGGACVGAAINPATPVVALEELAGRIDLALCMTVNPGWGGQEFIARSQEKVARVHAAVPDDVAVEVDGGITTDTAPQCRHAGARVFVAGSAIFGARDPGEAYRAIARSVTAD
jgi:ribulose-phosphate 3-epimerase